MQLQAEMIGRPVARSMSADVSALGAAYLAGLAVGLWASQAEIARLVSPHDHFEPRMAVGKRDALYAGWRSAVKQTVFRPLDR